MNKEMETAFQKAEECGKKADPDSIRELCSLFSHPLWPVRRKAADLLETLARNSAGPVPVMLQALGSADHDKRFWAATVLASLQESSAIFRIIDLINSDEEAWGPLLSIMAQGCPSEFKLVAAGVISTGSEATRKWTIKALEGHLDSSLADTLADSLPRFSPKLRFDAFSILSSARDGKAFERLISPLGSCPWPARGAAYRALFLLAERPGAPVDPAGLCMKHSTARDRDRLAPALAAALAGSDPSAVALGAARLVGPSARAALMLSIKPGDILLRAAIAHLSDPEPELRCLSALMLARSGMQEGAEPLLQLLSDGDIEVRLSALTSIKRLSPMWDSPPVALGELIAIGSKAECTLALDLASRVRTPALPGLLIPLANHKDPHVRARVAGLLGKTRGAEVIETLGKLLSDNFWPVRRAASTSLARLGEEAVPKLREIATRDDMDGGYWAAAALGGTGSSEAIELLYQLAGSDKPPLRRGAVRGLARVKDPQALKAVEKALDDSDRAVRVQAVKALLRHLGSGAGPRLRILAGDDDPEIRYWSLRIMSDSRVDLEKDYLKGLYANESVPANRSIIERLLKSGGDENAAMCS